MRLTDVIGGALLLVLASFSVAEGAQWVAIGTGSDNTRWYVDTGSVAKLSKDTAKVSTLHIVEDNDVISVIEDLWEFNCATGEYRLATQDPATGGEPARNSIWHPVTPESVGEALYRFICPREG